MNCPVCQTALGRAPFCPSCGWDTSADSELYPTLFSAAGMPARTVRSEKAERKALTAKLGDLLFADFSTELLRECAKSEAPEEAVWRMLTRRPTDAAPKGDGTWRENILQPRAFDRTVFRKVRTIRFQSFYLALPENALDLSQEQNGSVMACLSKPGSGLTLTVYAKGGVCAPEDCRMLFWDLTSLRSIDFDGCFHTEDCLDMRSMFQGCTALQELDLRGFSTSGVRDMSLMFCGCSSLQRLYLDSRFSTSSVTDMHSMFSGCAALEDLDLTGFNTSRVTDMHAMFIGCAALRKLDLSSFNASLVKDMRYMFGGCAALEELNSGSLDDALLADRSFMYDGCVRLGQGGQRSAPEDPGEGAAGPPKLTNRR